MGRHRLFDEKEALEGALGVFMRHGFRDASIDALTDAMGISRPSLYFAFENKETLFERCITLFEQQHNAFFWAALKEETPEAVLASFLEWAVGLCLCRWSCGRGETGIAGVVIRQSRHTS